MRVVGARIYNIIVHIFLFLKTIVYITSMLNSLVAVPVQGYVHVHTIKYITSIYMYVIILFYNTVLYPTELFI